MCAKLLLLPPTCVDGCVEEERGGLSLELHVLVQEELQTALQRRTVPYRAAASKPTTGSSSNSSAPHATSRRRRAMPTPSFHSSIFHEGMKEEDQQCCCCVTAVGFGQAACSSVPPQPKTHTWLLAGAQQKVQLRQARHVALLLRLNLQQPKHLGCGQALEGGGPDEGWHRRTPSCCCCCCQHHPNRHSRPHAVSTTLRHSVAP